MTVTLFGHRDAPLTIYSLLEQTVVDLIDHHGAIQFHIGTHGNFDRLAQSVICNLRKKYPNIQYVIVLSRIPTSKNVHWDVTYANTMIPDGLENVPPRFGIEHRNRWMLDHSDIVISYVKNSIGGASKFTALAKKKCKRVINLAETDSKN